MSSGVPLCVSDCCVSVFTFSLSYVVQAFRVVALPIGKTRLNTKFDIFVWEFESTAVQARQNIKQRENSGGKRGKETCGRFRACVLVFQK